jgi:hypothetical protein
MDGRVAWRHMLRRMRDERVPRGRCVACTSSHSRLTIRGPSHVPRRRGLRGDHHHRDHVHRRGGLEWLRRDLEWRRLEARWRQHVPSARPRTRSSCGAAAKGQRCLVCRSRPGWRGAGDAIHARAHQFPTSTQLACVRTAVRQWSDERFDLPPAKRAREPRARCRRRHRRLAERLPSTCERLNTTAYSMARALLRVLRLRKPWLSSRYGVATRSSKRSSRFACPPEPPRGVPELSP